MIAGGITALGLAYSKAAQSNLIFNGPIDDAIVRYEEGQGILFENNVMTIRKNGYVYTFTDSSGEHNIDWQNNDPNFGDDLLEEIVIRDSIGRVKRISRKNVNNKGNIESDVATISYDFANQLYNSTRGKIREFLRQDYSSECEGMKKNLSELQKQDR